MANRVIKSVAMTDDNVQHYGVVGMKWGKRIAAYRTNKLEKKTNKMVRRFDRGKDVDRSDVGELSRKVRQHKARIDRKVKELNDFLDKGAKADAKQIVNRFNKDPEKQKAVKDYMDTLKAHTPRLDELRLSLIDIRV